MIRAIPVTSEQIESVEKTGMDLMRRGRYDEATVLMTLCLAFKHSPIISYADEEDAEVVEFPGHSVKV